MTTLYFAGDATAVAQVDKLTPANVEVDDIFTVTINGKSISYTAAAATVADVTAGLTAAWNASTIPEFAEITASDDTTHVTLTADTAGKPFTVTTSTTNGGAADTQTLTRAAVTANDGPNAWTANNFKTAAGVRGTALNDNDVYIFRNSDVDLKYGLGDSTAANVTLRIEASYTGEIGLPQTNEDGSTNYNEYRERFLTLQADTIAIGDGEGDHSSKIRLKAGANVIGSPALTVYNTGTSSDDEKTIEFDLDDHSITGTATIENGSVLIYSDSSAVDSNIGTLNISGDANVTIGRRSGNLLKALTALNVNGSATVEAGLAVGSNITTASIRGGALTLWNAAATLNAYAGEVNLDFDTADTLTTVTVGSAGKIDASGSSASPTFTNTTLAAGAEIYDPHGKIVFTNAIDLGAARLEDFTLDFGPNRNLLPS